MPQITFEASDNIIEQDLRETLSEIHQILVDVLPTKLESCKSRVIRHKEFLLGDGDVNNAFIHLSIRIIEGRTKEIIDVATNQIMIVLQNNFKESANKLNLKFSVAIDNLPQSYLKT
jgi:5-carboxymethyl-2-hydroxymuconate isomerase